MFNLSTEGGKHHHSRKTKMLLASPVVLALAAIEIFLLVGFRIEASRRIAQK